MTNYARTGRALEHAARKLLDDAGYWTMRSAGSKGAVDVLAMKPGQTLLVQCKSNGSLPSAEWNELYALAARLGAVPVLATGTPAHVEFGEMIARKAHGSRRKPMVRMVLDEVAEVTP